MGEHVIKLPDVGEGVAEAELVEWHVKIGDLVREDALLAAVMTDKATVEIPSPVDGEITWLGAEIGDVVAVGSPIIRIRTAGEADAQPEPQVDTTPAPSPQGEGKPIAVPAETAPVKAERQVTSTPPSPSLLQG
ncbi:MAG: biotin/lipoyl-containing protein, partial [Pseudaminobacter sp.]